MLYRRLRVATGADSSCTVAAEHLASHTKMQLCRRAQRRYIGSIGEWAVWSSFGDLGLRQDATAAAIAASSPGLGLAPPPQGATSASPNCLMSASTAHNASYAASEPAGRGALSPALARL